ncbi:MAG TPA: MAPEG family protein, partial [Burkholderiaceae bacterium]|nr:MAPEG family protein [Burkholderiaceae bacterium]
EANSFEAFPFFAAAVIVAHLTNAPQGRLDLLAIAFVLARIAYLACYVVDWHWARSVVWFAGYGACIAIFLLSVLG